MLLADVSQRYSDLVTTVFSSTIAAKAWLATAVIVLALVQVTTAARMWGRLSFLPVRGPVVAGVHRWSGRSAFVISLPVFFHCVTILGFQTPDARIATHSIAGIGPKVGEWPLIPGHMGVHNWEYVSRK